MGCHSFVIKVMNKGKIEQLSVACAGSCGVGKPCKPHTTKLVSAGPDPPVIGTVCYCDDELHCETCPGGGHEIQELKECKIGTVHKLGPDQKAGEAIDVRCFGECEEGICTQKTIFRRELNDGRVLEILECSCTSQT